MPVDIRPVPADQAITEGTPEKAPSAGSKADGSHVGSEDGRESTNILEDVVEDDGSLTPIPAPPYSVGWRPPSRLARGDDMGDLLSVLNHPNPNPPQNTLHEDSRHALEYFSL